VWDRLGSSAGSRPRFVQPICQAVGRPELLKNACDVVAATPAARGLLAEKGAVAKLTELQGQGRVLSAPGLHRNRPRRRPVSVSYSMADDGL
jgi:hypothetical protein